MSIPFTSEGFYGAFSAYNLALWPAQVFLLGLGVIAIALLALQRSYSSVGISGILTFLWAWQALAYHLAFFTVGMGSGLALQHFRSPAPVNKFS